MGRMTLITGVERRRRWSLEERAQILAAIDEPGAVLAEVKSKTIAASSLIRWSIQEVRRIAIRLARKRIQPAHIIAWSLWHRAHQAIAQRAHLKAKRQL